MYDFFSNTRPVTMARDAAVATSHHLATQAGLEVLTQGGNAVDAALAAVVVQCVVEAHMTGIGGDCFVLYAPVGKPVVALNGSGFAPKAASVGWFSEQGVSEISQTSPHAVTVPGAVSAWCRLHSDYGHLPLAQIFTRAIDYAENGYPITRRVAQDWTLETSLLANSSGAEEVFLTEGKTPEAGQRHVQPKLGQRLREIAQSGAQAFYQGEVAQRLVSYLNDLGGLHTLDDFAHGETAANYVTPIETQYRGVDILECPPNGQGVAALLILNILSHFDMGKELSLADRHHLHAEATKLAYYHRDALLADPVKCCDLVRNLLSPNTSKILAGRIDLARTIQPTLWTEPEHKDTVYLCVVDSEGNAISFINSIFHGFGSGHLEPVTGVLLHSRGSSFRLIEGHPNAIGPRKRPLHTIIPGMLRLKHGGYAPFGVMGGHYQAAGHGAFVSALCDLEMDPQEALDLPRSFAINGELEVEQGLGEDVIADLAARGHQIKRREIPLGGGQAIIRDTNGVLLAGSDTRKDGCALGY
ncbi:gamma-glutamyltransferase family protein [Aliiroseovarius sp. 2305UL8-7]|uniref:gamma-glutamyltransferase family protein n=1 Tax=Aliiroseovarius conchicola TaxID=3121637 RepID=UPI0035278A16